MLTEKFFECLQHEGVVAIATISLDHQVHIANTWNSYIQVTEDGKLLIPAAGMRKTQKNAQENPVVNLSLGSREVMGYKTMGTGFLLSGTVEFLSDGPLFEQVRAAFPFANRALVFTPSTCKQTL